MRCSRPTAALLTLLLALPAAVRAQAPPPPAQPAPPARPEEAPQPAFKISGLVCGDYYDVAQSRRDDLEAYADWQDRPDRRDVSTLEAFAGWQEKSWRASIQYGHQDRREAGPGGSDLALDFLSAFAAVQVTPRVAVLGRVDRTKCGIAHVLLTGSPEEPPPPGTFLARRQLARPARHVTDRPMDRRSERRWV